MQAHVETYTRKADGDDALSQGASDSGEVAKIVGDFAAAGEESEQWGDRRQEVSRVRSSAH